MSAQATRRRGRFGFGLFTLAMVALFVGLGLWQLQRRAEKHALIAALTERLAAPPVPLPQPAQWSALTAGKDEFRRVSFTATYSRLPDAMVYSAGSAVRDDISGPGTWAFLPARSCTPRSCIVLATKPALITTVSPPGNRAGRKAQVPGPEISSRTAEPAL